MSFQFPLQPSQNAIQGKELYNYFGNRVLESRASAGRVVAVKLKPTEGFARSEADMMHYASQKPGILAPQEQLRLFRQCTQPCIGRINRQEARNFYDRIHFHFGSWCLKRVKSPTAKKIWARLLPGMRGTGEQTFVLTHGDLAARNIMVKDGKITGIVDWEYSGLFPEYMEYAMATVIHDCQEDWWKPHLKEILEPCGYKRAKFTAAIKWRGW
ncbi:kinase-like domain-containing protein [Aspergillus pseudocaelatus]|uniref:non-specific serine/threonine protein kinase n=1 Tax=Aspergillus pseudocaelatus TaxID=1825620 RepID=A0ABQ6WRP0_9EURO|nr:kinase-like domain-containing protein [Aspergillus pseudocaelatus]